jgi:hypothetical protein
MGDTRAQAIRISAGLHGKGRNADQARFPAPNRQDYTHLPRRILLGEMIPDMRPAFTLRDAQALIVLY